MRLLQNTSVVCVTADLWSSRQLRSFLGITAHFIVESEWSLKSVMLACSHFRGSHTAEAINDEFQKVVTSFEITSKISFIVTDSAANMVKAFSLPGFTEVSNEECSDSEDDCNDSFLEDDEDRDEIYDNLYETSQHIRCFAHTLQLVIKNGFKQAGNINKVISKVSTIVSHVKKSIHAAEVLESEKALQKANTTRWNSQLNMIRSVLRNPEEKLNSLETQKLTNCDRKIISDLVEILTPFETATQCVQGDKVMTSSMIVPCIRVLKVKMSLSQKFSSKFVLALKESVYTRLSKYEECDAFLLASALDPRFKLKWCANDEYRTLKEKLVTIVNTSHHTSSGIDSMTSHVGTSLESLPSVPSVEKKQSASATSFFQDLIQSPSSSCNLNDTELLVEEYLSAPCLPQEDDPLIYWKNHEKRFSCIAKLVPKYLCMPASSTPVERLFSIAGKVFRPERCRLSDKTFETLMFIKCNPCN